MNTIPEFFEAYVYELDEDHASDLMRYLDNNSSDEVTDQLRDLLIDAHPELDNAD
jgi:hypothetical protein